MFKKLLRQVGIGSLKVDTKLEQDFVEPGSLLRGVIHIDGGREPEKIDGIYLHLNAQVLTDDHEHRVVHLERYPIAYDLEIDPGEHVEVDFEIPIPPDLPMTTGMVRVWIHTSTDTPYLSDPDDDDAIEVAPHPVLDTTIRVLQDLGFRLSQSEFENPHPQMNARLPFVQELDFRPEQGHWSLEELEMVVIPRHVGVDFYIEFDRRESWLEEAMDVEWPNRMVHVRVDEGEGQDPIRMRRILEDILHHTD